MKKQVNCKLSKAAEIGGFRLSPKHNDVSISALESDHEQAGPGSLTFVSGKYPASVYRCKASAILVIKELGCVIPENEGEVIPVSNPEEVFNRLLEACD